METPKLVNKERSMHKKCDILISSLNNKVKLE